MAGIKATRIQSIPGAQFADLITWANSSEGREVLRHVKFIVILCGGNSLSNGTQPHVVFAQAKRAVNIFHSLSTPLCQIFLSTLPPRPQIDSTSNARFIFNKLLIESTENTFHTAPGELGLIDLETHLPKPHMLKQQEAKWGREIVHLSPAGVEQLRRNYARTLGTANHGVIRPPYIIKKNEIGHRNSYHI